MIGKKGNISVDEQHVLLRGCHSCRICPQKSMSSKEMLEPIGENKRGSMEDGIEWYRMVDHGGSWLRQSEEHRLVLGLSDLQWQGDMAGDVVFRLIPAVEVSFAKVCECDTKSVLFLGPCGVRMIGWTEQCYQQDQCICTVYPNVSHILDSSSSGRMA